MDDGAHPFGLGRMGRELLRDATGPVLTAPPARISLRTFTVAFFKDAMADTLADIEINPASLAHYGPTEGSVALRAAIAVRAQTKADNILVTDGGSNALHLALATAIGPGAGVLVPAPGFPAYRHLCAATGNKPWLYGWENGAADNVRNLVGLLARGAHALILCNPHNPSGGLLSLSDLRTVLEAAKRHNVFVILDDAYAWMAEPQTLTSLSHFSDLSEGIAATVSLGKFLCLPGLRAGALVTPDLTLISAATELKRHLSQCTCPMSESLATSLLGSGEADAARAKVLSIVSHRRRALAQMIAAHGGEAWTCNAGFFVYARTPVLEPLGIEGVAGRHFSGADDERRYCVAVDDGVWKRVELANG